MNAHICSGLPFCAQELDAYYTNYSGYGKPSALLLFQLAHSLQQEDNFQIWCVKDEEEVVDSSVFISACPWGLYSKNCGTFLINSTIK